VKSASNIVKFYLSLKFVKIQIQIEKSISCWTR